MEKNRPLIDIILVPQGAEYRAVQQGLKPISAPKPEVLPVPVGPTAIARHLNQLLQSGDLPSSSNVLMMGLCGSLTPQRKVGEAIVYQDCVQLMDAQTVGTQAIETQTTADAAAQSCDPTLTTQLRYVLGEETAWGTALTSDRVIWSAQEKQQLGQRHQAEVVDMEGSATLTALVPYGIRLAMVRVVSDGCLHNLPNIANAIDAEGNLQTLPLALGMMRQPIAASRLVRGSLKGLRSMRRVTTKIFLSSP